MTDEPSIVEVTAGPYRGQRLTMSKAEAEAAIAEKWAIDPHAPPKAVDPNAPPKEAEPMTDEQRAEIVKKAEAALRKLRGEPEAETRDMTAEKPAAYQTKTAPKK